MGMGMMNTSYYEHFVNRPGHLASVTFRRGTCYRASGIYPPRPRV